ncbi:hypothetical protein AZE42_02455, partial [Rhizopogon vesiculosus]
MPNSLTRNAGLRLGPVVLETLVKHYFDRIKKENAQRSNFATQLHQDELLYHEAFNIVKGFLQASTYHTVEEVQAFSNNRTPSPPWVRVMRVLVPVSCCDEAATYVVQALGGEEFAKRLVGGTKWWQVRGVQGVDAEWITARKDHMEAKKRSRAKHKENSNADIPTTESYTQTSDGPSASSSSGINAYKEEMDDMRCILYAHGVQPAHLVVAGDSAGGGLTLALLQVLRDTGLPLPAGGILISPWCDLTHSFPSVHTNTATDVIPLYGLSFHKPSPLWPPPSDEMTHKVHSKLRKRIHQMVRFEGKEKLDTEASSNVSVDAETLASSEMPADVGATTPPPPGGKTEDQTIRLQGTTGEILIIEEQVHLYTQNSLIGHPLISSAFSYLGGLPPLFFIASDKEVLRDEIIYTAHKAADPSGFPLKDEARSLYPPLKGIEARHGPTAVHLQVYDDTAHVLPVLFSFTTPGKFCYRAIASFTKHVTGMNPSRSSTGQTVSPSSTLPSQTFASSLSRLSRALSTPELINRIQGSPGGLPDADSPVPSPSLPKLFRSPFSRPDIPSRAKSLQVSKSASDRAVSESTLQPRFSDNANIVDAEITLSMSDSAHGTQRFAGESAVYCNGQGVPSWKEGMIRERVSTRGVIRPLEPESDLDVLRFHQTILGTLSELAVLRYLDGKATFDKKFAKDLRAVQKQRDHNLELSKKDVMKNIAQLQGSKSSQNRNGKGKARDTTKGIKEGLEAASASWSWAWALDANERPPPSSIVSRRDTAEARRLAQIADQVALQEHSQMSANSLWAV